MNRLKSKKLSILLCMLVISTLILTGLPIQVFADSHNSALETKTTGYTSISLKWGKVKGAKGYVISRGTSSGCYNKSIKTISNPKTTTYNDNKLNKNTFYYYRVQAFKYVNGKKKNVGPPLYDTGMAGVDKVYIDRNYLDRDTSSSIGLAIYSKNSNYYKNIEIYRSTFRDKGYKKISTTKQINLEHINGLYANYIDKDKLLKPQTSYYYKVRAILKVGSKTLYGPMSSPVLHETVNRTPVFNTTVLTLEGTPTQEFKVKIDSDQYNAPARMHTVKDLKIGWQTKDEQTRFLEPFRIDRYSFDDVNYMQPEEYLEIPPGKTIYIYFTSNTLFSLPKLEELKYYNIYYIDREAKYDLDCLSIDLIKNEVSRDTTDD